MNSFEDPAAETFTQINKLMDNWQSVSIDERSLNYVDSVNTAYNHLTSIASHQQLETALLRRSLWAKKVSLRLVELSQQARSSSEFDLVCRQLIAVQTLLSPESIDALVEVQHSIEDGIGETNFYRLLAEHSDSDHARKLLGKITQSEKWLTLLGPPDIRKFRPFKKSGRFDPNEWLQNPAMQQMEFVNGKHDCVRYRGLTFCSGDLGLAQMNVSGDGILGSFSSEPQPLFHNFVYLTRRVRDQSTGKILYQPSAIEIYAGGWRLVPLSTVLNPRFSLYSEWVRPFPNDNQLGAKLNQQMDEMETFAFDFKSRPVPKHGNYEHFEDGPAASCTNFVRVPFIRAGYEMPYPQSPIHPGAIGNLDVLGLSGLVEMHTATDILLRSGFQKIGLIDNGLPERMHAQTLVVGRPEIPNTFGGWFSQRELVPENLPCWKNIRNPVSALKAGVVSLGQSKGMIADAARSLAGVAKEEVPTSASATTIEFYRCSELEAGAIVDNQLHPHLLSFLGESRGIPSIGELRADASIQQILQSSISKTKLEKERWYR